MIQRLAYRAISACAELLVVSSSVHYFSALWLIILAVVSFSALYRFLYRIGSHHGDRQLQ